MDSFTKCRLSCLAVPGLGILIAAFSGIMYSASAVLSKCLTNSIDPGTISIIKSLMITVFSVILSIANGYKFWKSTKLEIYISIICGLLAANLNISWYYSCQMTSIASAMTLFSMSPLFVIFISVIFMRVLPTLLEVFTSVLCTISIVLCIQPDFIFHLFQNNNDESSADGFVGKILALSSACSVALVVLLFQKIKSIDFFSFAAIHHFVVVIVSIIFVGFSGTFKVSLSAYNLTYLFSNGAVSIAGSYLFLIAIKIESPILATIGRTADVASGIVFSAIIFNQTPNLLSILAGVILIIAIVIPALYKYVSSRR